MPILNGASNIPGMMIQFKDGGLELRQATNGTIPSTRSILILGTAIDGPIMEPVAVDAITAEAVFGKGVGYNGKLNGATLPEAFNQLYKSGCRDIRMMRISGSVAKASISAEPSSDEVTMIKRQVLEPTGGNDVCVFDVGQQNISDVHVYSNDIMLSNSKFTVDGPNGLVTLLANSVTAGSLIAISYDDGTGMSSKTDELEVASGADSVVLTEMPVFTEDITVMVGEQLIPVENFDVDHVTKELTCDAIVREAIETVNATIDVGGGTIPDIAINFDFEEIKSVSVTGIGEVLATITEENKIRLTDPLPAPEAADPINYHVVIKDSEDTVVCDETIDINVGDSTPDFILDPAPVGGITATVNNVNAGVSLTGDGKGHLTDPLTAPVNPAGIIYEITIDYTHIQDGLEPGDIVTVEYQYLFDTHTGTIVKQNSTVIGGSTWVASAADFSQEITLAEEITGMFRLYVDGREIGDTSAFEVDDDVLKIEKKKFPMGLSIEVAYEYMGVNSINPIIDIESKFGGVMYNDCTLEIKDVLDGDGNLIDKEIILQKPIQKRNVSDESPLSFFASEYESFDALVEAINGNVNNNVFKASTEYSEVSPMTISAAAKVYFTGGEDQTKLSKQSIFERLSGQRDSSGNLLEYGAYQLLQNYKVDFVVPIGVYADDELIGKYDNFSYELALFCAVASQVHLTHGIIAVKPPKKTDLASLELHVKKLEGYSNIYFMKRYDGLFITDNEGGPFDLGGYISIVAGPELTVTSSRQGQFNDSGVLQYAGLLSTLKASSAPTNKKLVSVSGSRFSYSVPQLNRLAARRFVTFQQRVSDNSICPTDGVTAARVGSDYSRVVNINVVRECLNDIYTIAEPYIGEPISNFTNNALSTAIEKKLTERSDPQTGDIETFDFQLNTSNLDKLIGDTKIELTIVPKGERRRITVVVGLKPTI